MKAMFWLSWLGDVHFYFIYYVFCQAFIKEYSPLWLGSESELLCYCPRYDVELYQRIEQLIDKKLPLFKTEEEEVMMLMERVTEAQRYAKMVGARSIQRENVISWNQKTIYAKNISELIYVLRDTLRW